MSKIRFVLCLICVSLLLGCASQNLQKNFEKKLTLLDRKSLVLAKVTLHNQLHGTCGFILNSCLIGKDGDSDCEKYSVLSPTLTHLRALTEDRVSYLIVLEMDSGNYSFYSLRGIITGHWSSLSPYIEAPMLVSFQVKEKEVLYIGSIHLMLRKKASDSELMAGPIIPLVDQAPIWGATFDVNIIDEYERDMQEFEKVFPSVKGHSVAKRILPSWRRPSSQEFEPKKTYYFFF